MTRIVSISLPDEMAAKLDQLCLDDEKKRSEYVRDCIRFKWKIEERLNDDDGTVKQNLMRLLTRTVIEF